MRLLRLFVICIIATACKPAIEASNQQLKSAEYQLITVKGEYSLTLEVAETPQQKQMGLMFRRSLPEDTGMIFLYNDPLSKDQRPSQYPSLWMKNTFIPLDMVFLKDNKVVHLHESAQPHDLSTIQTPVPADSVAELPEGAITKYNIQLGDILKVQ